jgi:hypothetical protein
MNIETFKNAAPRLVRHEPPEVQEWFNSEYANAYKATNDPLKSFEHAKHEYLMWKDNRNKVTASVCSRITECIDESILPAETLSAIKKVDKHPFLAIFGIGKEGVSYGGQVKKIWSFSAIKNLAKTIVTKVKESVVDVIGDFHKSSDNEQRNSLGKVVHSFAKDLKEGLQAYSVLWITDESTKEKIKSGYYDACSVDITAKLSNKGQVPYVDAIYDIDNITIVNSKLNPVGFGNAASLVTTIQETIEGDNRMAEEKTIMNELSLSDIKIAIAKYGINPTKIFSVDELLADANVEKLISKQVSDKVKEETTKISEKADKKLAEANEKISKYQVRENDEKLSEVLKNIPELANKSDKEIKYIKGQLKDVKVLDVEKPEEIVSKAVGNVIQQMNDLGITFKQDDKVDVKTPAQSDSKKADDKAADTQAILAENNIQLG